MAPKANECPRVSNQVPVPQATGKAPGLTNRPSRPTGIIARRHKLMPWILRILITYLQLSFEVLQECLSLPLTLSCCKKGVLWNNENFHDISELLQIKENILLKGSSNTFFFYSKLLLAGKGAKNWGFGKYTRTLELVKKIQDSQFQKWLLDPMSKKKKTYSVE